jgi:hypothetical protein
VPERVEVLEDERHPGAVVEQHLAHGRPRQRVADRDHGERRADLLPDRVGRVERGDDEAVDELVGELAGQDALAVRVALRVHQHHLQLVAPELAAEGLHEALLAQVLERAGQDAHDPGPAARERARHGVAGVAEVVRRAPHALLRLRRGLEPAEGVRHGRGREAGGRRDVLDRDALPGHHQATVPGRVPAARRRRRDGRVDQPWTNGLLARARSVR